MKDLNSIPKVKLSEVRRLFLGYFLSLARLFIQILSSMSLPILPLLPLLLVVVVKVAILAFSLRIHKPLSMWTLCSIITSSILMIAVVAHSLRIML